MKNRIPIGEFFYFSRSERCGILVLIAIIALVFFSGYFYSYQKESHAISGKDSCREAAAIAGYRAFIASIREEEKQQARHSFKDSPRERAIIVSAPFNPNTADSMTFCRLGLPDWMTRNILRYRSMGGKFRKAEDFRKIYGLTEKEYRTLLPYIHIAPEDTVRKIPHPLYASSTAGGIAAGRQEVESYKYPAGTVIDLNRADTTTLKKIPGIGTNIAHLIVGYRQRLGGFYRIEQLQEIHLDYHQLQPWLRIDSGEIRRINLNQSGIERLRSHPYINFYQAKAIVEYRKKKGTLNSLKPFALYEEFSETDLERISHYVCFE